MPTVVGDSVVGDQADSTLAAGGRWSNSWSAIVPHQSGTCTCSALHSRVVGKPLAFLRLCVAGESKDCLVPL